MSVPVSDVSCLGLRPSPPPLPSRRILLNYAVFNPDMGYCQGMSDLVAPLLTEVQDESDTFWCFVGLMENTIFISSPRDEDMERQLVLMDGGVWVGGWMGVRSWVGLCVCV